MGLRVGRINTLGDFIGVGFGLIALGGLSCQVYRLRLTIDLWPLFDVEFNGRSHWCGSLALLVATFMVSRTSIVPPLAPLDIFHGMRPYTFPGIVVAMIDEFELERWGFVKAKSWRLPGSRRHSRRRVQRDSGCTSIDARFVGKDRVRR